MRETKIEKPPLARELLIRCRELRKNTTDAEQLLWGLLRSRQLVGAKFRRQHPVGPYILDFYCHEVRLAIEIDGGQHAATEQVHYDEKRTRYLEAQGIRVLRFWNNDALNHTEEVMESILDALTPTLSQRERENSPYVEFEIFKPKTESEVANGTVTRAKAMCLCCNTVLAPDRVRAQLRAQRGGADVVFDANGNRVGGARLLVVVTLKPSAQGRQYRLPTERDHHAVWKAAKVLEKVSATKLANDLSPVPDEPLPLMSGTFNVPLYGMNRWGDLFTARQNLALLTFGRTVQETKCPPGIGDLLGLVIDRVSSRSSSLCLWRYHADQEKVEHVFGRQALPVVWDFAEAVVTSESTGSFQDGVGALAL